jgi:secreted PhoX family phosphatase
VVPTAGPQRGNVQLFLTAVAGAETASLEFTPDTKTFLVSIQHPGEEGSFDKPVSSWPDRQQPPRPAVIQVWNDGGGPVGVVGG